MCNDAIGGSSESSVVCRCRVRYGPMSNAESHSGNVPAPAQDASHEPDLAKIERDLAEIELMLERLN